jgi:hypothetical protein
VSTGVIGVTGGILKIPPMALKLYEKEQIMNINLLLLYQIFIHLLMFWFHRRVMALLACDVVRYVGAKVPLSTAPMSSLPVLTLIAPPAPKPCIASMVGVSPSGGVILPGRAKGCPEAAYWPAWRAPGPENAGGLSAAIG